MNYPIDEKYTWKIPSKPLNLPDIPLEGEEGTYYHFHVKKINTEKFIKGNPFFEWLAENYKFSCGLIKMEPNKLYDWHIDAASKTKINRGVCINALVTPSPSLVLFTDNLTNLMAHGGEEFQTDIIPFTYDLNEIYLFNTARAHSVYNFEKERLLFTLEFELEYPLLTYERVKNKIKTEFLNEHE